MKFSVCSRAIGRFFLVILTSTLISACGLEFRPIVELPQGLKVLHVLGGDLIFNRTVKSVLLNSGVALSDEKDKADAVLTLFDESDDERVVVVDAQTNQPREYELSYTVFFRLHNREGEALFPAQKVHLIRNYVFDQTAVIGSHRERGILQREMRIDAAHRLLRIISKYDP